MKMKALILALLLTAPMTAYATPADVAAAVATAGRPAEATKLDESRKPAEVLAFLGLEQGDRVLDLFTGGGYYAEIMAKAVGPQGAVVAWEPANFVDEAGTRNFEALQRRAPNVELLVSPADALSLPERSFDFVLMHMIYHDLIGRARNINFPASTRTRRWPRCSRR